MAQVGKKLARKDKDKTESQKVDERRPKDKRRGPECKGTKDRGTVSADGFFLWLRGHTL